MISWSGFISLLITAQVVTADNDVEYDFFAKLGTEMFLPAKSCAEIYRINKASRGISGYYWIKTDDVHLVYCDMELSCGDQTGGWMRIYSFATSNGDACPVGWYGDQGLCRGDTKAGCYSAYFPTYKAQYKHVCGKVKGYQKGTPNAFYPTSYFFGNHDDIKPTVYSASLDGVYVDGVSITFGSPRKHVWTYAVGLSDDATYDCCNCPCAKYPGPPPPYFVQDHYYCESGNTGSAHQSTFYDRDVLWDGKGCAEYNNCCSQPGLPWFYRLFPHYEKGDFEVRICYDQDYSDESVLIEAMEIYVQ